jgi:hypothetical protein
MMEQTVLLDFKFASGFLDPNKLDQSETHWQVRIRASFQGYPAESTPRYLKFVGQQAGPGYKSAGICG